MRTPEEIADHIKSSHAFFDFTDEVLSPYLPYSLYERAGLELQAQSINAVFQQAIVLEKASQKAIDLEEVRKEMLEYLAFAWGKCEDRRGLSAQRSISKLRAWVWLLEDAESIEFLGKDSNYAPYGAPMLAFLSKKYGAPQPTGEYIEMMIAGDNCPDCS